MNSSSFSAIEVSTSTGITELIQSIVSLYWTSMYCICILWRHEIRFNIPKDSTVITLRYKIPDFEKVFTESIDNGCQTYIVQEDILTEYLNVFSLVHDLSLLRFPRKQVIIVMDDATTLAKRPEYFAHEIFDEIPHTLIIMRDSEFPDKYNLFTLKFVGKESSEDLILLDSYFVEENSFENNRNLFPDKLKNLQQKAIKYATFNYEPYSYWEEVELANESNSHFFIGGDNKRHNAVIDGTETMLMLVFCELHNCSIQLSLDEAGEWGEIDDNRTGNGVLGALVERRADVGAGALYSWSHEFQYLTFSKQITRTGITCIVPRPRPLASWKTPIRPFSVILWLAVSISILVALLGFRLIYRIELWLKISEGPFEGFGETLINVAKMYLLQSIQLSHPPLAKIFVVFGILVIAQLIATVYGGGLSSIMTVQQFEKSIDTVEELASSNMKWGATHDAWIFSILLTTQPTIVRLLKNFVTLSKNELLQMGRTTEFSFSIERLPYGHYALGEYIDERAANSHKLMIEDIYWESCIAMSTKTWPLIEELDSLILLVAQSGIQRNWELMTLMKHSNNKIQKIIAVSRLSSSTSEPTILAPEHLVGVFILLGMGLLTSSFVFLLELLHHYLTTCHSIFNRM